MRRLLTAVLTLLSLTLALPCAAVSQPEVIGQVYAIAEPDFYGQILAHLKAMQRNGQLALLQQEGIRRAKEHAVSPTPLAIPATSQPRQFLVDPTYTAPANVLDEAGRIIIPAGTTINPFDHLAMSSYWLFFDGRDQRQVSRAQTLLTHYAGRLKLILTGGDYRALNRAWHRQVYFDQQGIYTRRLGITQVPALVSQDGKRLRVAELALD